MYLLLPLISHQYAFLGQWWQEMNESHIWKFLDIHLLWRYKLHENIFWLIRFHWRITLCLYEWMNSNFHWTWFLFVLKVELRILKFVSQFFCILLSDFSSSLLFNCFSNIINFWKTEILRFFPILIRFTQIRML